jgi:hypothetical protein
VIGFFCCNGLVNNADKAAVLYNGKGISEVFTVENVGGENLHCFLKYFGFGCMSGIRALEIS